MEYEIHKASDGAELEAQLLAFLNDALAASPDGPFFIAVSG